jgi:23S rRNA (pseudouridine1915-N3)-methyltransferase
MKIQFWTIGKAHEAHVKEGIDLFTKRIRHYYSVEWQILPVPRNSGMLSESDLKQKEGLMILDWLEPDDYLIALDEKGKQMTSEELATFIQNKTNQSSKRLIFLIGGAYGLDEKVLLRANYTWSLSKLVFPHQLVRLILAEQIYRACTIIRNEKYHHA